VKVGDKVRHKKFGLIGIIHEIAKHSILVNWTDESGVMFRWTRKKDLEVINEQ